MNIENYKTNQYKPSTSNFFLFLEIVFLSGFLPERGNVLLKSKLITLYVSPLVLPLTIKTLCALVNWGVLNILVSKYLITFLIRGMLRTQRFHKIYHIFI